MITIITGPSHSGKTYLANQLTMKHGVSNLSLDHLKMGLIRSGLTDLTPMSDSALLTSLLWPITKEIIKTAIENSQNLIIEGIYIPLNWQEFFEEQYLTHIEYFCIIFSEQYILNNFDKIVEHENVIENRIIDDSYSIQECLNEHYYYRDMTLLHNLNTIEIKDSFNPEITLSF